MLIVQNIGQKKDNDYTFVGGLNLFCAAILWLDQHDSWMNQVVDGIGIHIPPDCGGLVGEKEPVPCL